MTGSAVKLFREVRPARPPSSAWSAFWNPRRAARRWRESAGELTQWPASRGPRRSPGNSADPPPIPAFGMWRARCGSDPWLVPDRHPAWA